MTTLQGTLTHVTLLSPFQVEIHIDFVIGQARFRMNLNDESRPHLMLVGKQVIAQIEARPIPPGIALPEGSSAYLVTITAAPEPKGEVCAQCGLVHEAPVPAPVSPKAKDHGSN